MIIVVVRLAINHILDLSVNQVFLNTNLKYTVMQHYSIFVSSHPNLPEPN